MGKYQFAKAKNTISSVGTIFDVNKKTEINLSYSSLRFFCARIGTVQIQLDTIVTAATVSFKLTEDEAGDNIIIQSTTGEIDYGLTTTNKGSVGIQIDATIYSDVETFYLFPKVDAGSCNISSISITYESNEF